MTDRVIDATSVVETAPENDAGADDGVTPLALGRADADADAEPLKEFDPVAEELTVDVVDGDAVSDARIGTFTWQVCTPTAT